MLTKAATAAAAEAKGPTWRDAEALERCPARVGRLLAVLPLQVDEIDH